MVMKNLPKAIGPYSSYRNQNFLLITSGQLPLNPETNNLVSDSFVEQLEQCLENVFNVLIQETIDVKNILKLTVYLTDLSNFSLVNKVFMEKFREPFPARTVLEVSKLPMNAQVEIEAIAVY